MTKQEIRARIANSLMAGLVPTEFEIINDDSIEFIPGKAFWAKWKVGRNWMEAEGCQVYAIPRYRKPKPEEWRCRLVLPMLLSKDIHNARVDNNDAWHDSLSSIFEGFEMRDCTPDAVLDTMAHMKRTTNQLEEITIACRSRNIAASDDLVLECLRSLWKDSKIAHRNIGDRDFFIYQPK